MMLLMMVVAMMMMVVVFLTTSCITFTAQQIRDAMRFNLGDDALGAYFGVSQNTIATPTMIPDGEEGQIIYDGLPSGASYVLPDNTVMKKP